ncbi:MAG: MFS transporter, partial [Candidatus Sulfotelmatobacter sp.]
QHNARKTATDNGPVKNDNLPSAAAKKKASIHAIQWLTFFLADVQTGLGPFLAAYLASSGWNPAAVGYALTFGGLVTVGALTPAGAVIDAVRRKRRLIAIALALLVVGALLLMHGVKPKAVYAAQFLIGFSGPFLAPTVAAITLGIVGAAAFDKLFGKIQAFNAAGNVFTALLVALVSYRFGYHAIFLAVASLVIPTLIALSRIDPKQIDYARARGAAPNNSSNQAEGLSVLFQDRLLVIFLATAFLFHLANAAMLPELGEMLSRGKPKTAASFMSACVIVTQLVISLTAAWIGKRAATHGRKPLLLLGFGVLPIRGILYTLTDVTSALIAIQVLDGVANAIFGIVSILVIKDRTEGTGRFNIASGSLATMVGIGAALSTTIGGMLIQHFGYHASFLGLAGIGFIAFALLWVAIPETLSPDHKTSPEPNSEPAARGDTYVA